MLPQAATTFFKALGRVLTFWQKSSKADSLVRFTQATRVEPIVIVDQRTMHLPYISDLMQSLNSIFAGYYLQAAALTVNVGRINVGKLLGHLNPDRGLPDIDFNAMAGMIGVESHNAALECLVDHGVVAQKDYRYGLPSPTKASTESLPDTLHHALEADVIRPTLAEDLKAAAAQGAEDAMKNMKEVGKGLLAGHQVEKGRGHTGATQNPKRDFVGTDLGRDLKDAANLSVGRLYTVEVTDGGHSASIPVTIRLLATECASDLLVHILSDGARLKNSTAKERNFAHKLGDLKFWRDLVFCTDLIDEHRNALMKDTNGVYKTILDRRRKNAVSGAFTGEPTVGTASNMVVTTRDTIRQLEEEIGGKFSNPKIRQKVFEQSYLMIVAVVDPDYDHVTFYYRGIDLPTELSVRDIKAAAKGSGPDVLEILRTFQSGLAPSF